MKSGITGSGIVGAPYSNAIMMGTAVVGIVLIDASIGGVPVTDFEALRNIDSMQI